MQHHFFLLLLVATCFAWPGKYALTCPDESVAVDKGLHVCCEQPPFVYCVLCARVTNSLYTSDCATHCNGTVSQSSPHCANCQCRSVSSSSPGEAVVVEEEEAEDRYRGCPFMRAKKKQ